MCISTGNFDSIFFLGVTPFLNLKIWPKWKILLKQLVSATPLKLLNRIAWNFVVMKGIMCRYEFIQELLIWSFWGAIYIPFFVGLPVPNAWNCHSLYTAFSSNVGVWGMWASSLFLSFLFFSCCNCRSFMVNKNTGTVLLVLSYWHTVISHSIFPSDFLLKIKLFSVTRYY